MPPKKAKKGSGRVDAAFVQKKAGTRARDAGKASVTAAAASAPAPRQGKAASKKQKAVQAEDGASAKKQRVELPKVDRAGLIGCDDVPDAELLLRRFDLDATYGPCVGIDRRARWERAVSNGLNPPAYIRQILDGEHGVEGRSVLDVDLQRVGSASGGKSSGSSENAR